MSIRRASLVGVFMVACSGSGETSGGSAGTTGATNVGDTGAGEAGTLDPTSGGGQTSVTSATTMTSATTESATGMTGATTATTPGSSTTSPDDTGAPDTADPDTTAGTSATSADTGDEPPPLDDTACNGYATRYWDCCKAHCGWPGNVNPATTPMQSCDKADQSHGQVYDVPSSCQTPAMNSAFTCYSGTAWAVSETLAYGFAAVPAQGDICGRCYQLEFAGTGHYNAQDPGSVALAGKTMIVQATNIGFDVGGGQFDILTPGGGVGLFDACSYQWDVDKAELGATYGGFMTYCQQQSNDHAQQKQCVLDRCAAVFDDPSLAELAAGCKWYVDWYEAADNPNLRFQEVACPGALVAISGIDRGPLDDVTSCKGGGGSCTQEEMDNCDCSWTNGGQNCGMDDGSCCWTACCG